MTHFQKLKAKIDTLVASCNSATEQCETDFSYKTRTNPTGAIILLSILSEVEHDPTLFRELPPKSHRTIIQLALRALSGDINNDPNFSDTATKQILEAGFGEDLV